MMTETIETNADTSMEVETTQEPTDVDTSNVVNDNEPAETDTVENTEEVTEGKYKTLEQANKAYSDLEKKLGEQSAELGELRKMRDEYNAEKEQRQAQALANAQNQGFNTVLEYENHNEMVNFIADEFEKNIGECSYPDEVHNLIEQYRKTPDDNILKTIKSEFDIDTIEKIALQSKAKEQELYQKVVNQVKESAGAFLQRNINENAERFQNPAFAELYGEAFLALGENLDTSRFCTLLDNYTASIMKSAQINQGIVNENISATDEIAGLTSTGGNTQASSGRNILDLPDAEMKKVISKYI
jgi:hypothetical protein